MKRMVLFTLIFAVVSLSLACGGGAISVLKKPSSAYLPATPFIGRSEDRNVFKVLKKETLYRKAASGRDLLDMHLADLRSDGKVMSKSQLSLVLETPRSSAYNKTLILHLQILENGLHYAQVMDCRNALTFSREPIHLITGLFSTQTT